MTDKIEEIRKALEGATPGPWKKFSDEVTGVKASDGRIAVCTQITLLKRRHPTEAPANAHLIALAPDMARIVLAAEKLAEVAEYCSKYMRKMGHETAGLDAEIKAYRAAVEGGE